CTSRRSPQPLNPPPTLSFSSTKPAGTCRHVSSYRPTLPSSRCHPNVPSSTRLRTCGSSCATTGFQTESSNHTTISSTIVARPGTSSSISLGASCPSDCANGRTSSDQWDSVLGTRCRQRAENPGRWSFPIPRFGAASCRMRRRVKGTPSNLVQLLAQLGWGDTSWLSSSQPIPKGGRFKQIFMLRNLPDFHADSSGDSFEICLLVCGHRNVAFWDRARAAESCE